MAQHSAKERISEVAARQAGVIAYSQLRWLGIAPSTIHGWRSGGYLELALPCVFAVAHAAPSQEASLWAAVLYAGPGAMLSHRSAARWLGLIDYSPPLIEVSTPRRATSVAGVRAYGRRLGLSRVSHRGVPVTTIPATMIDLAATSNPRVVHRALGQLDFQKLLDVDSLLSACGSGRQGAVALRAAIEAYDPRGKYANGPLEEEFYALCKRRGLPLPVLNTHVHAIKCDAYWPQQGLVVELDGVGNHSSPAQQRRDRRNDLALRSHGLTVLRYDWGLVRDHAEDVCADVLCMLARLVAERRGRTGAS